MHYSLQWVHSFSSFFFSLFFLSLFPPFLLLLLLPFVSHLLSLSPSLSCSVVRLFFHVKKEDNYTWPRERGRRLTDRFFDRFNIWTWKYADLSCDVYTFIPVVIDFADQSKGITLFQLQFNSRFRLKVKLGPGFALLFTVEVIAWNETLKRKKKERVKSSMVTGQWWVVSGEWWRFWCKDVSTFHCKCRDLGEGRRFVFDGFLVAGGRRKEKEGSQESSNDDGHERGWCTQKSHGSEEKAEVNVCTLVQLEDWLEEGSRGKQRETQDRWRQVNVGRGKNRTLLKIASQLKGEPLDGVKLWSKCDKCNIYFFSFTILLFSFFHSLLSITGWKRKAQRTHFAQSIFHSALCTRKVGCFS